MLDRWLESNVVIIAVGLAALLTSHAFAEASILRSLPPNVQMEIEKIRQSCRETDSSTVAEGDEGLKTFSVSGAQAVLIDELNVCGSGFDCIHGVNCATGYTHDRYLRPLQGRVEESFFGRSHGAHLLEH